MQRYRTLTLTTCVGALLLAATVLLLSGARIEPLGFLHYYATALGLGGLSLVLDARRPMPRLSALLGTTAATLALLGLAGVIAHAGLARGAPLIDQWLVRADAMLGLDARAWTEFTARDRRLVVGLTMAYQLSVPLVFATLAGLSAAGCEAEAWRYCLHIGVAVVACALISVVAPAAGAVVTLEVPKDVLHSLILSGDYHVEVFRSLYGAEAPLLDMSRFEGVVTFPSFHVAMAVLTAHAWARFQPLAPIAWGMAAAVTAATIPVGGHYFTDLIAGALLSAALVAATGLRAADTQPVRPFEPAMQPAKA